MGRRCPLEGRKAQHQLIKVFQQSGETSCYVQDDIDFLTCVLTLKTHAAEATLYVTAWTLQCLLTLLSRCRQAANSTLCIFSTTCQKRAPITPLTASVDSNNSAYGRSCLTDKFDDDRLPLFQLNKQIRIFLEKLNKKMII